MTLLPVVMRELNVAARNKATRRVRVLSVVVGMGLVAWLLVVSTAGLGAGLQGQGLFTGLSMAVFHFCLIAGPLLTADAISSEKREGTLGLLFLTDLRGHDIIGGKLVAASVAATFAVLGIVPVLSLALMLGGVTLADIARAATVWLVTLFASVSAGILVSTLSRDDRKAMACAAIASFAIGYGAYAPAAFLDSIEQKPLAETISLFSAGFAHKAALDWLGGAKRPEEFSVSLIFLALTGFSCLIAASQVLPRVTGERAKSGLRMRLEAAINRWSYGEGAQRQARRSRLLDANPFLWLGSRHQRKRAYMWLFLGSMLVIWCWMTWGVQGIARDWRFNGFVILGLHALVKFWWLSEVAERFVEDRRNGAVELIFTTPATPAEFAAGQSMALRRTFGSPIGALLALEFLWVWFFRLEDSTTNDNSLRLLMMLVLWAVLAVDLWALVWLGLWNALTRASAQRASQAAFNAIALWPWVTILGLSTGTVFVVQQVLRHWIDESVWSAGAILLYGAISLGMAAVSGVRARRRFLVGFRVVASEGFNARAANAALAEAPITRVRLEPIVPSPNVRDRRPWIRRHWIAATGAFVILSAVLAMGGYRWYWGSRLEARIAGLKTQSLPTTIEEFSAMLPPEDPGDGVRDLLAATTLIAGAQNRALDSLQWPTRGEALNMEQPGAFQETLKTNAPALAALARALARPTARMALDANGLTVMSIQSAYAIPRLGNLLATRGLLELNGGNVSQAVATVHQLFELARRLSEQPAIHTRSWSISVRAVALDLLEHCLSRRALDARERSLIEADLLRAEEPKDIHLALIGVQAQVAGFDSSPGSRAKLTGLMGMGRTPVLDALINGSAELAGIADRERERHLEELGRLVRGSTLFSGETYRSAQEIAARPNPGGIWSFNFGHWLLQSAAGSYMHECVAATRCRAARLVLAADAWREKTGKWPATPDHVPDIAGNTDWYNPLTSEKLRFELLPDAEGIQVNTLLSSSSPAPDPAAVRKNTPRRYRKTQSIAHVFAIERPPAGNQ